MAFHLAVMRSFGKTSLILLFDVFLQVPGVMISHGFQASAVNNVDPCLLRAVGCDKARGGPDRICFAAAALRSLLAGRMNKS